jgi:hypothetical protein
MAATPLLPSGLEQVQAVVEGGLYGVLFCVHADTLTSLRE